MSDQRLQTRGGERWPGMGRRRCGADFPTRRSKPHRAWRACCAPRSLTAGRPVWLVLSEDAGRVPRPHTVGKRGAAPTGITRLKCDHRGRCGANLKTPRAGRLWIWRTCGVPCRSLQKQRLAPNDTRQASMSRGVEARGSIRTSGVPRALGFLSGRRFPPSDNGGPGAE